MTNIAILVFLPDQIKAESLWYWYCRRLRYVAHYYAPHACGAPRKRCCARARFTQLRAWAAPMSGVRDARCASLLVCAWLQSPRAPLALAHCYSPAFRLVFLLSHFCTILCRFWPAFASLLLCAFAPLLCSLVSRLSALLFAVFCSSALVSVLHSSLLCSSRLWSASSLHCIRSSSKTPTIWLK